MIIALCHHQFGPGSIPVTATRFPSTQNAVKIIFMKRGKTFSSLQTSLYDHESIPTRHTLPVCVFLYFFFYYYLKYTAVKYTVSRYCNPSNTTKKKTKKKEKGRDRQKKKKKNTKARIFFIHIQVR